MNDSYMGDNYKLQISFERAKAKGTLRKTRSRLPVYHEGWKGQMDYWGIKVRYTCFAHKPSQRVVGGKESECIIIF